MDEDSRDSETISASQAPTTSGAQPPPLSSPPAFVFQPSLPVGEKFGSYRLIRVLGRGGMGEVYEAEHEETGRRVALKVLSRGLPNSTDRARFLREGRLAASISHPNSVYIYGTEEIGDTAVIAMELVPGGTLKDSVERNGPMAPREAVDAILQVVDGLEAAAARGVLHRDIKPSNCFLSDNRAVKIGDYGLSMSTVSRPESHLTETGTFLGTPAFASPEQVRGDTLDERSDIYAVGATLYYLVTGRAPFEGRGVGQVLSSVLERAPERPRRLQPELPRGLERVILRCLEKQPASRFPEYAALRRELRAFSSVAATPATLGLRFAAGIIDLLVVGLPCSVVLRDIAAQHPFLVAFIGIGAELAYFTILEGFSGASLGKRILRLRVIGPDGGVPGLPRAFLRTCTWLLVDLLALAAVTVAGLATPEARNVGGAVLQLFLLLLLFATARQSNGFAGLHDLVSRTRVIRRQVPRRRSVAPMNFLAIADSHQRRIGPYVVLETLAEDSTGSLLLGADEQLRRRVWIRTLPAGSPAVSVARRDLGRPGRLRWLNGRRSGGEAWDAYEAPEGCSLSDAADRRPGWETVRFWLLDLAEELAAGEQDATLPSRLDMANVWITTEGRAKLLDFPVSDRLVAASGPLIVRDFGTVQDLLHGVCLTVLKEPVPLHASSFIQDLSRRANSNPAALVRDLKALLHHSTRVSRGKRVVHLLLSGFLALCLSCSVFAGYLASRKDFRAGHSPSYEAGRQTAWLVRERLGKIRQGPRQEVKFAMAGAIGLTVLISLGSAILFRGGLLLHAMGIAVVTRGGVKASRLRALFRGTVAWFPGCLMIVAILIPNSGFGRFSIPLIFVLGAVLMAAGAVWAALTPERGLQDRIAGTFLVPR